MWPHAPRARLTPHAKRVSIPLKPGDDHHLRKKTRRDDGPTYPKATWMQSPNHYMLPTASAIREWMGHKGQPPAPWAPPSRSRPGLPRKSQAQAALRLRDSPDDGVLTPSPFHSNQYPRSALAQSRPPRHRGQGIHDGGMRPEASPTMNGEDGHRGGTEHSFLMVSHFRHFHLKNKRLLHLSLRPLPMTLISGSA